MAWHQRENGVTAGHFETWYEPASVGQFDGQGHQSQSRMSVEPLANIWSAASLQGLGAMTPGTTTSWPIPAGAGASAGEI